MITASTERAVNYKQAVQAPQAIDVRGLTKRYGTLEAVRGITFEVNSGEMFGLIGPDGAGKTSTFQILAGVMEATAGSARILGRPARDMRFQTGYLTQGFSLYPDLTVAENIRYSGDLRLIPPDEIADRSLQYLKMFDMDRFSDRLAGQLSGGMKQKLALVCALVPQPKVLLLDEPTTGVDPVSRREFWDALAHLSTEGLTILVATPYMDEAERSARRRSYAPAWARSESNSAPRTSGKRKAFFPRDRGRIRRLSMLSALAIGSTCWCTIRTRSRSGSPRS